MSKFIRTIGNTASNGISFDLYENKDASATIRPVRNMTDLPRKKWQKFDSLEAAENRIDDICGNDLFGAQRVAKLKEVWL